MNLRRLDSPGTLADLFLAAPEIHLYGLADLEEPFWSNSSWYRQGNAAVGLVALDGGRMAGYAMSSEYEAETLDLLSAVQHLLPPATWITGPTGLADRVAASRAIDEKGVHIRMILASDARPPEADRATTLTAEHMDAVIGLHESAPGSAFFLPSMLASGHFVGIWERGRLIASAGTHVASSSYGVAAVGAVITHPEFRGQGLGTAVTAALVDRLRAEYPIIGLNVHETNAARRLYERLGFETFTRYEEIELL